MPRRHAVRIANRASPLFSHAQRDRAALGAGFYDDDDGETAAARVRFEVTIDVPGATGLGVTFARGGAHDGRPCVRRFNPVGGPAAAAAAAHPGGTFAFRPGLVLLRIGDAPVEAGSTSAEACEVSTTREGGRSVRAPRLRARPSHARPTTGGDS